MSASSENWLHFRMEEEHYKELDEQTRERMDIVKVEVKEFDYSTDEMWKSLKSESVKSYKKLKEREYNLRFNK